MIVVGEIHTVAVENKHSATKVDRYGILLNLIELITKSLKFMASVIKYIS